MRMKIAIKDLCNPKYDSVVVIPKNTRILARYKKSMLLHVYLTKKQLKRIVNGTICKGCPMYNRQCKRCLPNQSWQIMGTNILVCYKMENHRLYSAIVEVETKH